VNSASRQQLHRELLDAFPAREDLERLFAYHLDVRLPEIVSPTADMSQTVFRIIEWAEAQGRTDELLSHALVERPRNARLAALVESLRKAKSDAATTNRPTGAPAVPTPERSIGSSEDVIPEGAATHDTPRDENRARQPHWFWRKARAFLTLLGIVAAVSIGTLRLMYWVDSALPTDAQRLNAIFMGIVCAVIVLAISAWILTALSWTTRVVGALAALLIVSLMAADLLRPTEVTGYLLYADDKTAVPNATVIAEFESGGERKSTVSASVDTEGYFRLRDIPPGVNVLTARANTDPATVGLEQYPIRLTSRTGGRYAVVPGPRPRPEPKITRSAEVIVPSGDWENMATHSCTRQLGKKLDPLSLQLRLRIPASSFSKEGWLELDPARHTWVRSVSLYGGGGAEDHRRGSSRRWALRLEPDGADLTLFVCIESLDDRRRPTPPVVRYWLERTE
jgi:Effector-associated domain 1